MKRIFVFALPALLLSLLLTNAANAQSRRSYSYNNNSKSNASEPEHRFVVGLAPLSLITPSGKVNVHAEWAYADNKSLSLMIGVPRTSKAPNWLSNDVTLEGQGNITTNKYHAFGVVAENRFYFAHKAPTGFYLAPYVRYNRMWLDHTSTNPENKGETTITGAIAGFGVGGSVGWQFRLGEHMTLDATVVGVDVKWMHGELRYQTNNPENDIAAFRDKVQETVKDIPFVGSKLVAAIDGDVVKARSPGFLIPAYRFNLTVNYAF